MIFMSLKPRSACLYLHFLKKKKNLWPFVFNFKFSFLSRSQQKRPHAFSSCCVMMMFMRVEANDDAIK